MSRVSVVIPTIGRGTRLYLTLCALARQTLPLSDVDIIVVDDSPSGGIAEASVRAVPGLPQARVLTSGGRGAASARNAGAAAARGDVLVFVDDDSLLAPDALAAHVTAHAAGRATVTHGTVIDLTAFAFEADPPSSATGPEPGLPDLRGRRLTRADIDDLSTAAARFRPRQSVFERLVESVFATDVGHRLRWISCVGTHTAIMRQRFDEMGGFDEQYDHVWGGEDLELGLRIALAGGTFARLDAVAYHLTLVRRDADRAVLAFWQRVAERHRIAELAAVGRVLAGLATPDDLARIWSAVPALDPL